MTKVFERRVTALEEASPARHVGTPILDGLTTAQVKLLEDILSRHHAGQAWEDMTDDELRLVASIRFEAPEMKP